MVITARVILVGLERKPQLDWTLGYAYYRYYLSLITYLLYALVYAIGYALLRAEQIFNSGIPLSVLIRALLQAHTEVGICLFDRSVLLDYDGFYKIVVILVENTVPFLLVVVKVIVVKLVYGNRRHHFNLLLHWHHLRRHCLHFGRMLFLEISYFLAVVG